MTSHSPSTVADVIVELRCPFNGTRFTAKVGGSAAGNARIKRVARVAQRVNHYNIISKVNFASTPFIRVNTSFVVFNNKPLRQI